MFSLEPPSGLWADYGQTLHNPVMEGLPTNRESWFRVLQLRQGKGHQRVV